MNDKKSSLDFSFIDYYQTKLTEKGAKTTFKYLVCNKLNIKPKTFEMWVYRQDIPAGSIEVLMVDLINDPNNGLPNCN